MDSSPEQSAPSSSPTSAPSVDPGRAALEAQVASLQTDNAALRTELQAARARVQELALAYQAAEKDREDFKRRLSRERDQLLQVERGQVALGLIEGIDQLELCLAAADDSPLARGVRLIHAELLKKLEGLGVERLELIGTRFDPNLAEASDLEPVQEAARDGLVTAVTRAAYASSGRVVRAGLVRVARLVQASA